MVYKYFLFLHKGSYILGIIGYLILMFTLLGVNLIFNIKSNTSMDIGICLLFYGIYYGVLGRDLAEICTYTLACKIGVKFKLLFFFFIYYLQINHLFILFFFLVFYT